VKTWRSGGYGSPDRQPAARRPQVVTSPASSRRNATLIKVHASRIRYWDGTDQGEPTI
jgi:hypothetical protein